MKSIVRQDKRNGVWGISTGLEFVPGRYTDTEDLIEIAEIAGEYNGVYSNHLRGETDKVYEAIEETIRIAKEVGVRADVSRIKICGKSNRVL